MFFPYNIQGMPYTYISNSNTYIVIEYNILLTLLHYTLYGYPTLYNAHCAMQCALHSMLYAV